MNHFTPPGPPGDPLPRLRAANLTADETTHMLMFLCGYAPKGVHAALDGVEQDRALRDLLREAAACGYAPTADGRTFLAAAVARRQLLELMWAASEDAMDSGLKLTFGEMTTDEGVPCFVRAVQVDDGGTDPGA